MNNMWGSMAQYSHIYWGWEIAFYLFLAGLSAGAMLMAILLRRAGLSGLGGRLDNCFKFGVIVAPVAIVLGLFLLVLDLGKPFDFYWILLKYNFDSVMSIGVVLLLAYSPLAFAYAFIAFADKFGLKAIAKPLLKMIGVIEILLILLSLGVGAYTGFLLSAVAKIALWHNWVLPLLFLASAISAGAACVGLFGESGAKSVGLVLRVDTVVIVVEIILLGLLFASLGSSGTSVLYGSFGVMFFTIVLGAGLAFPLILSKAHSKFAITIKCTAVLVGVLALRFFIVYAGQMA